jgi:short-subunit dehydrogenase
VAAERPIAAVTGASRGIGRATAVELARAGYRVMALARNLSDLEALAGEGRGNGWEIVPIEMDVADERSRSDGIEAVLRETDGYGVDVLVNNAGYGLMGALEDISPDAIRRLFEVNVFGLLAFTQAFLPGMRSRRRGRIVILSSAAGRVSTPFTGAYSASKFALEALSDALRLELAPFGIQVVLIEPGPIPTHFGRALERAAPEGSAYAPFFRRYTAVHDRAGWFGRSAQSVARVVLRAVRSDHPRARYTITPAAKLASLERFAPTRVRDSVLRLVMGLRGQT